MSKARNTGNLNNSIQITPSGDIRFMHDNNMLMQVSSSGAITTTGVISGSNALSASYAATGTSASYAASATSASYALSATTASYALSATSASFTTQAITASYADTLTVAGTLTAQTLVVQTITSSVDYVTGSTRFGSILGNTHAFTGSMSVSGSATFSGSVTSNGTLTAGLANGNIRLKGSTDGFLGVGESNGTLYLADWATSAKGLSIVLSTGAATFSNSVTAGTQFLGSSNTTDPTDSTTLATVFSLNGNSAVNPYGIGLAATRNSAFDMFFQTGAANGGGYRWYIGTSEKMTMSSTGNVGIGITTPTGTYGKLTVAGGIQITNDNNAKLEIGRYSSGAPNSYIKIGTNSNSLRITNAADSADLFSITNSGSVSIGTTAVGYKLFVSTTDTGAFNLNAANCTVGAPMIDFYDTGRAQETVISSTDNTTTGTYIASYSNHPLMFGANAGASPTAKMTLTSAGVVNIGNGSYSPYITLKSGGSTNYAGVINMDSKNDYLALSGGSTTGYGSGAYIYMYGSDRYGTNTAGMLTLGAGNSTNNSNYGYISFDTANTERMRINSSGYVTKPYNPAFRAYYSVNSTWTLANDTTFVFNATEYNIGSCYNTSNGRFTAPVAGVYQFNFYSIVLGNYQNAAIAFRKNDSTLTSGYNIHFSPYQTATVWHNIVYTTSLYLNASDYVSIANTGGSTQYHGDDWSSFSGYLVG
jgi:hypothetical protein